MAQIQPIDRTRVRAVRKSRKTTSMNLVISYDAPTGEQTGRKHCGAKSSTGCVCRRCEKYRVVVVVLMVLFVVVLVVFMLIN